MKSLPNFVRWPITIILTFIVQLLFRLAIFYPFNSFINTLLGAKSLWELAGMFSLLGGFFSITLVVIVVYLLGVGFYGLVRLSPNPILLSKINIAISFLPFVFKLLAVMIYGDKLFSPYAVATIWIPTIMIVISSFIAKNLVVRSID